MAAAKEKKERNKKTTSSVINEKLNDFVQKNRRILVLGLIVVVVILIGFIVSISVRQKIQTAAFSKLDGYSQRYEDLKSYIGSDKPDAASKQGDITTLLNDLSAFQKKNYGFAAAKAYSLSAGIYDTQKNWADAEKAWSAAAKAAPKSYLAPVSVFNAAVASEEQGNIAQAIDYYTQALTYGNEFPSAARAQFSVGRLQESQNNKDAALSAYKNLVSKWPSDPLWANLAQSRIMVLSE